MIKKEIVNELEEEKRCWEKCFYPLVLQRFLVRKIQ